MRSRMPPCEVLHPGEFILEELVARGWSESDLAYKLGISARGVEMLLSGRRIVGPVMAKHLGRVFDVSPELFLNLQRAFDAAGGGGSK